MAKRRKKNDIFKILAVLAIGFWIFGGTGIDTSKLSEWQLGKYFGMSVVDRENYYLMSTGGQIRKCDNTPFDSKVITLTTSPRQELSCGSVTGLMDVWWYENGQYKGYITEYENPTRFLVGMDDIGKQVVIECYKCPELPSECSGTEQRCISQVKREKCVNGAWQPLDNCNVPTACYGAGLCDEGAYGAICGNGVCEIGESTTCYSDCDIVTPPSCNNDGICSSSELSGGYCPNDCGGQGLKPVIKYVGSSVSAKDGVITTSITIKNDGDSMPISWLMEVQHQTGQPMAIVSEQKVCDTSHPENVHRTFKLDSGEQVTMIFTSPKLDDGTYKVWGLSRDKCWITEPQGNNKVDPFKNAILFDTIKIGEDDVIPPHPSECKENEFELNDKCYSKNLAYALAGILLIGAFMSSSKKGGSQILRI